MKDLTTYIQVDQGGRVNTALLADTLARWQDSVPKPGKYTVKVTEDLTSDQRAYFHAVIIPFIRNKFNEYGNALGNDDIKDFLKRKFLPVTQYEIKMGKKYVKREKIGSTEKLSKKGYSELIENTINWCIDLFGEAPPEAER